MFTGFIPKLPSTLSSLTGTIPLSPTIWDALCPALGTCSEQWQPSLWGKDRQCGKLDTKICKNILEIQIWEGLNYEELP